MASEPTSAQRGVGTVLWLGLALCAGLGVALVLVYTGADEPAAAAPSLQERVEAIDVVHAADVLSVRLEEARADLASALMPGDEETLAQLLRLQAESAELSLSTVRFEPQSRAGLLREVALEVEVVGAYYDLPIFVDGLYRQRHVVEIRRLTIESSGPQDVRVVGRIEARLFRPVVVPEEPIRASIDAVELDASERGFATTALATAAQLEAYERFIASIPSLQEQSQANRRLVLRTIPQLVRKLPGSPMDWVGATFDGGEAQLAMDAP